jgi:ribonucleoside-diphosphate reductase alpha chain
MKVAMRVIEGLYDGVSTSELDNLQLKPQLHDYCASGLHNGSEIAFQFAFNTTKSFSETMTEMFEYVNQMDNMPLIAEDV